MLRKAVGNVSRKCTKASAIKLSAARESRRWQSTATKKSKIYVIYYSTYGHVHKLAQGIKEGADAIDGVETKLWQVPETLSPEILKMIHAPPKPDVPVISPPNLLEADAFVFGLPTRFGMMPAQMKAFLDGTGGLWAKQALAGKPAGLFFSTSTQNGGQETTALTAITQLTHHGMVYVPIGYTTPDMTNMNEIKGGSPYGAGTLSGADGSRQVSAVEYNIAKHQGGLFATFVRDLYRGRAANGK